MEPNVPGTQGWIARPDPETAVTHGVPHAVVSQILRPEVGAFLPHRWVRVKALRDAQHSFAALRIAAPTPAIVALAATLPSLTTLSICCGDDDGDCFAMLPGFSGRLRTLSLSGSSRVDAEALTYVSYLSEHLRTLDLSHCTFVHQTALRCLATLPLLEELNLSRTNIDATGVGFVAQLPHLHTLSLCGCKKADSFGALAEHTVLQSLDLSGTTVGLDDLGLFASNTTLLSLQLQKCGGVDSRGLALISRMAQLETLDIGGCGLTGADALAPLAQMQQLRTLRFSQCPALPHSATYAYMGARREPVELFHIGALSHLTALDLSNSTVDETQLLPLTRLPRLRSLDLRQCSNIGEVALSHVAQLPRLEVLDIRQCRNVDEAALLTVRHVATVLR